MVNNIIKYKFNKDYKFDIYNYIGKDTIITIDNDDNILYIQENATTPIFNIGQDVRNVREHINFLVNKGILEVVND